MSSPAPSHAHSTLPRLSACLLALTLALSSAFAPDAHAAREIEYRAGGDRYEAAWQAFYGHAADTVAIGDALVARGKSMVPAICEAVRNPDMKFRRHAIEALGRMGERRAMQTLESLVRSRDEDETVRAEALRAIYRLDPDLGARYANAYREDGTMLKSVAAAILQQEPWLLEPAGQLTARAQGSTP